MKAIACIDALGLPESALVDQRVPKKTLAEYAGTTATARRQIQEGIEELRWVAALKPSTCGVPAHTDETREYLELAVLRVEVRPLRPEVRLLRPEALDLLLVLLERLLLEPPPLRRLLSRTLRLETAWVRCEGRLATVSEGTRILASHFLQRIRLPAYFSGTL